MKDYTVKEIAELLEVSKPTVQKVVNDLSLEPVRIEKNKYRFYNYADTVAIIRVIKPDFEFEKLQNVFEKLQNETAKQPNETEKSQNETAKQPIDTEKPQIDTEKQPIDTEKPQIDTEKQPNTAKSEELELMKSMLSLIKEQLKEKDNQLAIKDKQIQDLNDRLAEAMELTRGQQYITAADKTAQLMEKSEAEEVVDTTIDNTPAAATEDKVVGEEQPPQKKSFWGRWFGK